MRSSAGYAMLSSEVLHRLWIESLNRRIGAATLEYAARSVVFPTTGYNIGSAIWDANHILRDQSQTVVDEPLAQIVDRIERCT